MEGLDMKITDEAVLKLLREKLEGLRESLANKKVREDSTDADDEDLAERQEAGNENVASIDVLETDIDNIERRIAWIEKNGDACAARNCPNKVEEARRKLGGVTCRQHMDEEEQILADREITD